MALLSAALPALACVPSSPRALRLGSMGVRVAAALIGLLSDAPTPVEGGALISLGVVFACVGDMLFGAWRRQAPKDHEYQLVGVAGSRGEQIRSSNNSSIRSSTSSSVHDTDTDDNLGGDKNEVNATERIGAELKRTNDESDSSGDEIIDDEVTEPSKVGPLCRVSALGGVFLSSAMLYFAFLRGLQLGADVFVVGGATLEVAIACTFGQVCLMSAALSVALQDMRGISLSSAATVVLIFALMAPLGMLVGAVFGFDGRSHSRKSYGGIVVPSLFEEAVNVKGVALARISCTVAGILLQQTLASVLPREQVDAEKEWSHKFQGSTGGIMCLDALLHKGVAGRYARTQFARITGLLLGWAFMTLLHAPALFA